MKMNRFKVLAAVILAAAMMFPARTGMAQTPEAAPQQLKWLDPLEQGAIVHGVGWEELRSGYTRLPAKAHGVVRDEVWGLGLNSAGLSLVFTSNAKEMIVLYKVKDGYNMFHMPSTGRSGIDLYATDCDGNRRWVAPDFPASFRDTIRYIYSNITYFPDGTKPYEFHLYLPPYNTVDWIKIGIPQDASISFYKESLEKPIVVYGTSITQGACTSRPANCWTGIVEREMEHPFINLGFSGNGRMEPELFKLLAEIDAKVYILDCMPNLTSNAEIEAKTLEGVRILRQKRDCPIILVEHSGHVGEVSNLERTTYRRANAQLKQAYESLLAAGYKDIYYMTHDEVGLPLDGMIEGVHPNDYGMRAMADGHEKKLREVLHEDAKVFTPCKQARDVRNYDWYLRHESVLDYCLKTKPQVVLIGDSITHFWAGDPSDKAPTGQDSWDELWKGKRVANLGFGWDRVENALWRVYHGELDGYEAEDVLLLIGTNNLGIDPEEKIADGIVELAAAVHQRQPKARIWVCEVLPRSGREIQVRRLNALVKARLDVPGAKIIEMGAPFVGSNGRIIKAYYPDGLHPNAEGYKHFAAQIRSGMAGR